MKKIDLSHLGTKWPSSIVARAEIGKFSGGLISPGTLANLDSVGEGPAGGFYVGRKKAYTVDDLIPWLESRAATGIRGRVRRD